MPTYDWLQSLITTLDPWRATLCRTCAQPITDRGVALTYAAQETDDAAPDIVRWYCSPKCRALGQQKG